MSTEPEMKLPLISAIAPASDLDRGARHVFEEYVLGRNLRGRLVLYGSGKSSRASSLNQLLADLRFGDVEAVLCADVQDFLALFPTLKALLLGIHALSKTPIQFSVLDRGHTFKTSDANFVLYLLDEFASASGKRRARSVRKGLARVAATGRKLGRPPSVDASLIGEIRATGRPVKEIARQLGVSQSSVAKALKRNRKVEN